MIIAKYIFLCLILLGASLIGNLVSRKYRNRVKELKDFKEICNIMQTKIKFTYEPLGDILEEISKLMAKTNRISEILKNISQDLKTKDFKTAWEDRINENKELLNLNEEDISVINGLGNNLGKTDLEGQISEIQMTMDFIDTQIQDAEMSRKKNEKLYRSLGTIFGLAIIIILI